MRMKKSGLFAATSFLAGALASVFVLAGSSGTEAMAAKACARSKFDTKLVGDACKAGGQAEAKKVMKAFVKQAKVKNPDLKCDVCHKEVGGDFPLETDALKRFKDLGGK